MALIDIGSPAINRPSQYNSFTMINMDNPANETGKITGIEIWANSSMTDCEVATFYVVSGNNLSTRDTVSIGNVTAGSKQTFVVNLDVEAGDYLGWYSSGGIERSTSGYAGLWAISGDNIPCSNVTFSVYSGDTISLYGTGTTGNGAAEENAIIMGTNF